MKKLWLLLLPLAIGACRPSLLSVPTVGEATLTVTPKVTSGALQTQAIVQAYTQADIDHLVVRLYTVDGQTATPVSHGGVPVEVDVASGSLSMPIVLNRLHSNTKYRLHGFAYKAPGTAESDRISTLDQYSYTDVSVGTSERPTMASLPVRLLDQRFAGQATGSFVILPGGLINLTETLTAIPGSGGNGGQGAGVETYAGVIYPPQNTLATEWPISADRCVPAPNGSIYFSAPAEHVIYKIDPNGILSVYAGTRTQGTLSNGPATSANLNYPTGLCVDGTGVLYFSDFSNHQVAKISTDGMLTIVAGTGAPGNTGDGGDALSATLRNPQELALTASNQLIIADYGNDRVRRVAGDGKISTIAGRGPWGYSSSSEMSVSPPTDAYVKSPRWPFVDGNTIYIFDTAFPTLFAFTVGGSYTRQAGAVINGNWAGYNGDNKAGTSAFLSYEPSNIVKEAGTGALLFGDGSNHRFRQLLNGTITTKWGNGTGGYTPDGQSIVNSAVNNPQSLFIDPNGNYVFSDLGNRLIRRINAATNVITTIGGNRSTEFAGNNIQAKQARFGSPTALALDAAGNLYVADPTNHRIRKIDTTGVVTTFAGTGFAGFSGDGGNATSAQLKNPQGVWVDAAGQVFIADTDNKRIRKVASGTITTVATLNGDPVSVVGNGTMLFIADGSNGHIVQVAKNASNATPTLFADVSEYAWPQGLALDPSGNLYMTDAYYSKVLKFDANANPSVFAGQDETIGWSGDGGPATAAALNYPSNITFDASGAAYIADSGNYVIRRVGTDGKITTVAGVGEVSGYLDSANPLLARFDYPMGIAVSANGTLYISDYNNKRIRRCLP